MKFAGFTPKQKYKLVQNMGFTGPMDASEIENFINSSPGNSSVYDMAVKAATKARASFVVVTRQGGTLGFANNDDSATQVKADVNADLVQAGLAGLVKTINHEWNAGNDSVFCHSVGTKDFVTALGAKTIGGIITYNYI